MSCDLQALGSVLAYLENRSVRAWVFGGWGEELRGLSAARQHEDIDLLYPSESFASIDALIYGEDLEAIAAKHFAHKRAILFDGVMVELFLVRHDHLGPHTLFWGRLRHDWPDDFLGEVAGNRVATSAALCSYRAAHHRIHAAGALHKTEQTVASQRRT